MRVGKDPYWDFSVITNQTSGWAVLAERGFTKVDRIVSIRTASFGKTMGIQRLQVLPKPARAELMEAVRIACRDVPLLALVALGRSSSSLKGLDELLIYYYQSCF